MSKHPSERQAQRGFTLIELMITVVIIGILTAIVLPNYSQYVQRGRRTEAQAVLMDAQQFMQRLYNANNSYTPNGAQPVLPAAMTTSPPGCNNPSYTIAVVATPTTFTLTATPRAGGPMASDACGTLSLNQRNAKSVGGAGKTVDDCWK